MFIIGARDFGEPNDDVGFQSYTPFENSFFFGPKDVYIVVIVGNLGTSTVTGTVTLKVKGPVKDSGSLDITLDGESGKVIFLKLNVPDRSGLYKLTGKLKASAGGAKTAKGAFGITSSAINRQ